MATPMFSAPRPRDTETSKTWPVLSRRPLDRDRRGGRERMDEGVAGWFWGLAAILSHEFIKMLIFCISCLALD